MVFIMAKDYIHTYTHTHTQAQLKQGWRASLILFTILTLSPDPVFCLSVRICRVIFTYVQVHVEARD